ncbi:MAG: F0F1 ATP synthase subunit alpha, partial [Bacteroidota bacterium]
ISIFLGTNGYLDEIPLEDVQRFEREFLDMMDMRHSDLLAAIAEQKDLTKEIQEKLHSMARDFVGRFKVTSK